MNVPEPAKGVGASPVTTTKQLKEIMKRVVGATETKIKRVRVACLPCAKAKRRCDLGRPCSGCLDRNMGDQCVDSGIEASACAACSKRKVKCDKQRPCSRCVAMGKAEECLSSGGAEARFADLNREARKVATCSSGSNMMVIAHSATGPEFASSPDSFSSLELGSPVEPEAPIHFPDFLQPFKRQNQLPPSPKTDIHLPRSLYQCLAAGALPLQYARNIQAHCTPRLRSALLTLFGLADRAAELGGANNAPSPPLSLETDLPAWESSRCAVFSCAISVPPSAGGIPLVDTCQAAVNDCWAKYAGIHKEEFFARLLCQDMPAPTTELRMLCRLLMRLETLMKAKMHLISKEELLQDDCLFARCSLGWARGPPAGRAALVRLRMIKQKKQDNAGLVTWSMVELTPEEYDTVAGRHPELCEALASEVLGPKTAAELLDPELDRRETLAHLSSTADGRAALDRLADAIHRRFAFFFTAVSMLLQRAAAARVQALRDASFPVDVKREESVYS